MNDRLRMKESLDRVTQIVAAFMQGGYEGDPKVVLGEIRKELDYHLKPLTFDSAQRRIDRIRKYLDANDHEAACAEKMSLYTDALRVFAGDESNLAKKVLVLEGFDIKQWG